MNRRTVVLAALASASQGERFTPVQVQKLFFLLDRKAANELDGPHFHFAAYDYGPFDSDVYSAIELLETEGLAHTVKQGRYRQYGLTPEGFEAGKAVLEDCPENVQKFLKDTVAWVLKLSFPNLVSAIYRAYPEMRENSIFRG